MDINAYLIRDYIRGLTMRGRILSPRERCSLRTFSVYSRGRVLCQDTAYLVCPDAMPDPSAVPEHTVLILSKKPADSLLNTKADILYTEEPVTLAELVNAVAAVFFNFHELTIRLQSCLYHPDPLQALGDCTLSYLRNPMGLYTRSFFVVRYFEQPKPQQFMYFQPSDRESYVLEENISLLMLDPLFLESWNATGPTIFPDSTHDGRCLFQNIRVEGKYTIRLVISEVETPLRDSDYPILDHLAGFYEQLFRLRDDIQINLHPQYLDIALIDCLTGKSYDVSKLQAALRRIQWQVSDTYFCCDIQSMLDNQLGSLDTACVRLENIVSNSVALVVQDHILLLCNLTSSPKSKQEILSDLRELSRENIFKMAVSREFSPLTCLGACYLQAKRALEIALRYSPSVWFLSADEYALTYILTQATQELPSQLLCPQGLLTLMAYDNANGRNYAHVLRVYLECNMHIAETTRKLFLQRQTFLYQLERIKVISGLNLDDPDVRLHLLFSYKLLDFSNCTV